MQESFCLWDIKVDFFMYGMVKNTWISPASVCVEESES